MFRRSPPDLYELPHRGEASEDLNWALVAEENEALRQEVARLQGLEGLAYRDSLTGLRNRRFFDERLIEECDRVRRTPEGFFSLLVLDVDDFKLVNDRYGHVVGDRTLQWLAGIFEQCFRVHDACCRTGGDEFMVILANANPVSARRVTARLLRYLALRQEGHQPLVTVSVGIATFPQDGNNPLDLLRAADFAMYRNKELRSPTNPRGQSTLRSRALSRANDP